MEKTNKFLRKGWMLLAALMFACGSMLTACGDDDDDDGGGSGTLGTPKYEKESALYKVTSTNTNIASIELTASGNYIVMPRYTYKSRMAKKLVPSRFMKCPFDIERTRASYDVSDIISGKFTKKGDGVYELAGFGTITIVGGEKNAYSLDIVRTNGQTVTVSAQKAEQYKDSDKTNALCRTWKIGKVDIEGTIGGEKVKKTFSTYHQFVSYLSEMSGDDYFDDEDNPTGVTFTKSGTYVVYYADGSLAVSTWAWQNEAAGKARYSWDYEDLWDDSESDFITITFSGNELLITEEFVWDDYDYYYDSSSISVRLKETVHLTEV